LFLDRIPDHAAVHETVQLARDSGLGPQSGFINAVLRHTLRDLPDTRLALGELRKTDPATATSHPVWLVDRWIARYGREDADRLLDANNLPPATYARVNTLRIESAALTELWKAEGVEFMAQDFPWVEAGTVFVLPSHPPLAALESFGRGGFYVQDPSTLLAVAMLDPQPGEHVLDACAAPGGKTTRAAQVMRNRGRVRAEDSNPARLKLVTENALRLGTTCVEVAASDVPPVEGVVFDRVLIDAPCSNTGVLRRRVELRWRLQPAELDRLRSQQMALLSQHAPRVKRGGVLVYSTCSLEPEENAGVVQAWLAGQSEFQLEDQRELRPWQDHCDGAFVAKIRRVLGG
jgi:16S rRNA (cytosine967-C5)-methyltransferase